MRELGLIHALVTILAASWIHEGLDGRSRRAAERERVALARQQANEWQELVARFVRQTGRAPSSLEEVARVFDPPVPTEDPWSALPDRPQHYLLRRVQTPKGVKLVVMSLGADGMFDGEGFGKDIESG